MKLLSRLASLVSYFVAPAVLLLAGCGPSTYVPSRWLSQVPVASRAQTDPLPPTPANIHEGAQQYGLYCTECHGQDGAGRRNRPSLRDARVRNETDGEIHWILVNGSKGHGMPAWRSLGEDALWQLVLAIRAMPPLDPK